MAGRDGAPAAGVDPAVLAPLLVPWYRIHRRELPWRDEPDPYRIWVSEIMLQQTRVDTVRRHYERFLARFPAVGDLAAANDEEVRAAWSGLGFYRRAANLHAGARQVVAEHGGVVPRDPDVLGRLPGIGRYTVGAILSAAHDLRLPILDGNVERVLCRLYRVAGDPRSSGNRRLLWSLAEALLPARGAGEVNQALMDLGATCCTPRTPGCDRCPLCRVCLARAGGEAEAFPEPRRRPPVGEVWRVALGCRRPDGSFLLVQRPAGGLLAGLWELPALERPAEDGAEPAAEGLAARCRAEAPVRAGHVAHVFSHRRWRVDVFVAQASPATGWDESPCCWVREDDLRDLGVPTATRKLLQAAGLLAGALGPRGG
ncbi:MAG: A/G-specific adenine glycosylase [Myxococcota bacterium]|nr:A/G-specific adenine glycosylase [Myxococcota bacterium]